MRIGVLVAARDRRRAEAFAARWGVPAVHGSYTDLLADPSLDTVYVPLPNGLHARWAQAAVEAGKHVLCVHGGDLGRIQRVETAMCFPLPAFSDIRYNFGLAGGALMDAGCYTPCTACACSPPASRP